MLTRRLIPCLDVRNRRVTKGVKFQNNVELGDPIEMAVGYSDGGCDELVFYDITASPDGRTVDRSWVSQVAAVLDIPFCVAGGIKTVADATRYQEIAVAEGQAKAITNVYAAIHEGDPTNDLIAIKYLEALTAIADGKANKVFLPLEATGIMSSIAGIGELFKERLGGATKDNQEDA